MSGLPYSWEPSVPSFDWEFLEADETNKLHGLTGDALYFVKRFNKGQRWAINASTRNPTYEFGGETPYGNNYELIVEALRMVNDTTGIYRVDSVDGTLEAFVTDASGFEDGVHVGGYLYVSEKIRRAHQLAAVFVPGLEQSSDYSWLSSIYIEDPNASEPKIMGSKSVHLVVSYTYRHGIYTVEMMAEQKSPNDDPVIVLEKNLYSNSI